MEGKRYNTIFRFALEQARHSDTYDSLLDVMRTRNMECEPQLTDDVLNSIAKSAWRYEQEGRNLVGRGRSVVTPHSVIDELIGENQDAFVLLTLLPFLGEGCVTSRHPHQSLFDCPHHGKSEIFRLSA